MSEEREGIKRRLIQGESATTEEIAAYVRKCVDEAVEEWVHKREPVGNCECSICVAARAAREASR